MRRVLIGSGNRKKLEELRQCLEGVELELVSPGDLQPIPEAPPETGDTFEDNAGAKALAYARATGLWTVADDSGLEVDILGGRPGVLSARFAGPLADEDANNAALLDALRGVPPERRGAGYVCVIALASPREVLLFARGSCRGRVLDAPRGGGGFGYDPLFLSDDLGRTFAEADPADKRRVSHRGRALAMLRRELPRLLLEAEAS